MLWKHLSTVCIEYLDNCECLEAIWNHLALSILLSHKKALLLLGVGAALPLLQGNAWYCQSFPGCDGVLHLLLASSQSNVVTEWPQSIAWGSHWWIFGVLRMSYCEVLHVLVCCWFPLSHLATCNVNWVGIWWLVNWNPFGLARLVSSGGGNESAAQADDPFTHTCVDKKHSPERCVKPVSRLFFCTDLPFPELTCVIQTRLRLFLLLWIYFNFYFSIFLLIFDNG